MNKILLVNGPNLNLLGKREPQIYGSTTLMEIENEFQLFCKSNHFNGVCFQSNHEGKIVDFLQENSDASYTIINPGALSHTSVALCDALKAFDALVVEVHISNIHRRETFRHHSYVSADAQGIIVGCGINGYRLAMQQVLFLQSGQK